MGKTMKEGNSKKAAGNAKKAAVAAEKRAAADAQHEREEAERWKQGSKSNNKKEEAAAKKAEAARKKAERDALLEKEEAGARAQPKGTKAAQKKSNRPAAPSRGLDLSQLDGEPGAVAPALNATGIENALDALELVGESSGTKVERHPERRFKAAYAAFEAKRLPEVEVEHPGLRRNQRVEIVRKEFEKSPDNPFNQVTVAFDASKEEIRQVQKQEREKLEGRLTAR